jgi:hypothetical protein
MYSHFDFLLTALFVLTSPPQTHIDLTTFTSLTYASVRTFTNMPSDLIDWSAYGPTLLNAV